MDLYVMDVRTCIVGVTFFIECDIHDRSQHAYLLNYLFLERDGCKCVA